MLPPMTYQTEVSHTRGGRGLDGLAPQNEHAMPIRRIQSDSVTMAYIREGPVGSMPLDKQVLLVLQRDMKLQLSMCLCIVRVCMKPL